VIEPLLNWFGYAGNSPSSQKEDFIHLLDHNNILYKIGYSSQPDYKDLVVVQNFSNIPDEIRHNPDKKRENRWWIVMETNNFKKSLMFLTSPRSREIRRYYIRLEHLLHLYDSYTHQFNEKSKETRGF
jgi:hypothetical protein